MKRLMCGLAAIMSLRLGSAVLADCDEQQMTGTIVKVEFPEMTIETAAKERVDFQMEGGIKPKVGEKVTVHYCIVGRRAKWIAYKIDKAGDAEGGSKR
jgi:hypothetical protein